MARRAGEFQLSAIRAFERLMPGTGEGGVIATAVLRTCLPDWLTAGGPRQPARPTRGTSVRAMEASLNHPYATVHRLVARLVRLGLLVQTDAGLAVRTDGPVGAGVRLYLEEVHDLVVRMLESVQAGGVVAAGTGVPGAGAAGRTVSAGLDMALRSFEYLRGALGDWTDKMLWVSLSALATRGVMDDPALDRLYADAPPPDSLRRPVPTAALARLVSVSHTTAWRKLKAMAADDLVTRAEGGWLILGRQYAHSTLAAGTEANTGYTLHQLRTLAAAGIGPAAYLHGRPSTVTLD